MNQRAQLFGLRLQGLHLLLQEFALQNKSFLRVLRMHQFLREIEGGVDVLLGVAEDLRSHMLDAATGVVGGAMLALGRALGETMAVTFVIGNAHHIHESLFAPGTTISATIANEFSEATTELYKASVIELGLILFFITFVVLASAQFMLRTLERRAGGAT